MESCSSSYIESVQKNAHILLTTIQNKSTLISLDTVLIGLSNNYFNALILLTATQNKSTLISLNS